MIPAAARAEPRSVRAQVDLFRAGGLTALEARLAVLPRLWLASRRELEAANQFDRGRLRERRIAESQEFWREFWAALRTVLQIGDEGVAADLLDQAVARIEPAAEAVH